MAATLSKWTAVLNSAFGWSPSWDPHTNKKNVQHVCSVPQLSLTPASSTLSIRQQQQYGVRNENLFHQARRCFPQGSCLPGWGIPRDPEQEGYHRVSFYPVCRFRSPRR